MERRGVKRGVRIALGKKAGKTGKRADGGQRACIVEDASGIRLDQLEIEAAEMLGQPRPPGDAQAIAGLEQRPQAARAPSPHQPEMAPMAKGEKLGDGVRLAERLGAEKDAFVAPVHASSALSFGIVEAHLAITFRILGPALPHLDEQKEMNGRSAISPISARAAEPISLMVRPLAPSTILRWLSRST